MFNKVLISFFAVFAVLSESSPASIREILQCKVREVVNAQALSGVLRLDVQSEVWILEEDMLLRAGIGSMHYADIGDCRISPQDAIGMDTVYTIAALDKRADGALFTVTVTGRPEGSGELYFQSNSQPEVLVARLSCRF